MSDKREETTLPGHIWPFRSCSRYTMQLQEGDPTLQFMRDICTEEGWLIERQRKRGEENTEMEAVTRWYRFIILTSSLSYLDLSLFS